MDIGLRTVSFRSPGLRAQKQRNNHICVSCSGSSDKDSKICQAEMSGSSHQCGLLEAARYARRDAMLVTAAAQNMDERARSDLTILARGFLRLDMRARQHIALLGTTVTKLDARAREKAHSKVGRFGRMATKLQEIAGTELKLAAAEHWNDGALEADLRLADLRARRRAMEDSFATFEAVKSVHNAAAKVLLMKAESERVERNPDTERYSSKNQSPSTLDRIAEFEDAYLSMASVLAEANVLDQNDPDELEFIIATLLDMDEVQGATGSSLVTETSSSPDTATRRALVDALSNAPSLWNLGNAGMSALQRLAGDENPEVSAAASKALDELEVQLKQIDSSMHFTREGSDLDDQTCTEGPDEE